MAASDPALLERLTAALAGPLPGPAAQQRMSPRLLDGTLPARPAGHREAAALVLLFERDAEWHVVLTLRASHLPHHADQVSLPGGRVEPGETPEAAALREAFEEVGVAPERVEILGRLTPLHIPVSGYTLLAIVGRAVGTPTFAHAPDEVADLLEVPLATLASRDCLGRAIWTLNALELEVPYFQLAGHDVWGATAMVLSEFLALLGVVVDPWG
jgi:8-oxo-dGTP pyrophosphatase MutT (NUDIX family)